MTEPPTPPQPPAPTPSPTSPEAEQPPPPAESATPIAPAHPSTKPRSPISTGCSKCGYSFAGHSLTPERCPECGLDARAAEEIELQPTPDPKSAITPGVIGCGLVWIGIFACALALAFSNALLFTVPIVWIGTLLCVYGLLRPRGERVRFPLVIAIAVVAIIAYFTWPAMMYPITWLQSALFR